MSGNTYPKVFTDAFTWTIGVEGGYSDNASDPGNWTCGRVGQGELKGTKYGISAASYPNLDIINISLAQAQQIYFTDYWQKLPVLSYWLSRAVFDAAVNQGISRAIKDMQIAVGTAADGVWGPKSQATYISRAGSLDTALFFSYLGQRYLSYRDDGDFLTFIDGWVMRLLHLAQTYAGRQDNGG